MMERSKVRPIAIVVRPEVAAFAVQMERKLRANDHKPHWRESTLDYLEGRLQEEVDELIAELSYAFFDGDSHNVVTEAADVANFAMFIADVAGGLELGVLDQNIRLNQNARPGADEVYDEWWTCPRCNMDDILRHFTFCPNCGRPIVWVDGKRGGAQWVDSGLDGPKELEETEPVDPFANVTNRYKLFCLNHGAESPEEMEQIELGWTGPGKPNFLLWLSDQLRAWKRQQEFEPDYYMTGEDAILFDIWLEEQALGGDSDGN